MTWEMLERALELQRPEVKSQPSYFLDWVNLEKSLNFVSSTMETIPIFEE
jgi:hypothetical protein